jgi:hypothetical protein
MAVKAKAIFLMKITPGLVSLVPKKMAKASERVKRIFMNGRSERTVEQVGARHQPVPILAGAKSYGLGWRRTGTQGAKQVAGHAGGFFFEPNPTANPWA